MIKTNKDNISFDEIVESIPFNEFKVVFLSGEEKALRETLKKVKDEGVFKKELQTFFARLQANLSDSDREIAKIKAKDPLYNIAYFARAVSKMHPGFGSEGQKAGFETEDFKSEVVKLYQKFQNSNLKLTNEREINQLLTDLLGIGLTTLQDNHFNIRTSEGKRAFKDWEKTKAEWTRERPLKTRHPEKGSVGENIAYKPYQLSKILTQENIGTEEEPKPLVIGEQNIGKQTFGVVGLSSIIIHWGTPKQISEIAKVEKITQAFEQHYKDWDGVIIDIRGNTGGDGAVSRKIARSLCGEEPPYCLKATKRRTKEAALREIGSPAVHEQKEWTPKTFHGSHKVFVLTDSKTGSASESFVPMLKHYEGATFIGENTNGCCQYGGTKPVRMPCGGIIQMGTLFRSYEDGMVECVGHKPDIDCQGRDALQVAFEEIQKEGKGKKSLNDTLSNLSLKGGHFKKWLHSLRHKNKQK